MRLNKEKYELACARACMNVPEIAKRAGLSGNTVRTVARRNSASPATIGKIARALGVDVLDILDDDEKAVKL